MYKGWAFLLTPSVHVSGRMFETGQRRCKNSVGILQKDAEQLDELPIPNISTHSIEYAVDQHSVEMSSKIKSDAANWVRKDRKLTEKFED